MNELATGWDCNKCGQKTYRIDDYKCCHCTLQLLRNDIELKCAIRNIEMFFEYNSSAELSYAVNAGGYLKEAIKQVKRYCDSVKLKEKRTTNE